MIRTFVLAKYQVWTCTHQQGIVCLECFPAKILAVVRVSNELETSIRRDAPCLLSLPRFAGRHRHNEVMENAGTKEPLVALGMPSPWGNWDCDGCNSLSLIKRHKASPSNLPSYLFPNELSTTH